MWRHLALGSRLAGWPFSLLLVAACGSAGADAGDAGNDGRDSGQAGNPAGQNAASGNSSSSGSGSSGHSDSGSDAGVDSGNGDDASGSTPSSDGGPDALTCHSAASSTATQGGYLGDWTPGDYPSNFSGGNYLTISGVTGQMGNARQYAAHVPTGYTGSAVPALFCIHGLGQNAVMFCLDTGVAWPTKADKEGFVVIMPNGYMGSWNGGTCCGAAASNALDDVSLIRAIFTEVGKHVNIDLGRVYATGLSNGGYLSYRLACEASDLFVAVAPAAGAIGTAAIGGGTQSTSDFATCAPAKKVSVLDIHGTSDPLIPYSAQKPSLATLQASYGCSTTTMPAVIPASGGDTACETFAGCPTCPNIEVTGCTVTGGGHCWFGSSDCGTGGGGIGMAFVGNNSSFMHDTDEIWAFLSRLSR